MKNKVLSGESRIGNILFRKMLSWLESPARSGFGDAETLLAASGLKSGQRVLEVGCGSGYFTPIISQLVGKDGSVDAIDMHPAALEVTQKKIEELRLSNARVTGADAHATAFPDESFDAVILFGVVPAPVISEPRLASELHRVLKPGGTLAVWTLSPFWSPRVLMKHAPFGSAGCARKVHRLMKHAA